MSTYTTQLRYMIESGFELESLKNYPIFDERYRPVLNKKIIDKYYFREIGLETPALFDWFLRVKLSEIMPYYNQLYLSEKLVFDPLSNFKTTETRTVNTDGTSNNKTDQTGTQNGGNTQDVTTHGTKTDANKNVFSDTPQGNIDIDSLGYATTLNKDDNLSTTDDTNHLVGTNNNASVVATVNDVISNTTENYTANVVGYNGQSPSDALIKFRQTFLRIDQNLLGELNDLFMGVW